LVFTAVFVSIILIVIIKYNMLLFASGAPKALRLYVVSARPVIVRPGRHEAGEEADDATRAFPPILLCLIAPVQLLFELYPCIGICSFSSFVLGREDASFLETGLAKEILEPLELTRGPTSMEGDARRVCTRKVRWISVSSPVWSGWGLRRRWKVHLCWR
jgi:hypothetical protein